MESRILSIRHLRPLNLDMEELLKIVLYLFAQGTRGENDGVWNVLLFIQHMSTKQIWGVQ